MMKLRTLFKSKLMVFCIQILILLLSSMIFNYRIKIDFDASTDPRAGEQQFIICFLANLIIYNNSFGFVYITLIWMIISLIPILIFSEFKKAYSMNLTTFFFPNFFFYVFYWRYSEIYFSVLFPNFIIKTIILGLIIVIESIVLSLILKFIKSFKNNTNTDNLKQIESLNRIKCPICGTQFDSIPKYCFNCNSLITKELRENLGKTK